MKINYQIQTEAKIHLQYGQWARPRCVYIRSTFAVTRTNLRL